jgi:uncharacterized tellurite resistance protein B-like protein
MELKESLDADTRLQLVHLACVAAWSDTTVAESERKVVLNLCQNLALDDNECRLAKSWLDGPPPYFDPQSVPRKHRAVFLDALVDVIRADGRVEPEECETLRLIQELLA